MFHLIGAVAGELELRPMYWSTFYFNIHSVLLGLSYLDKVCMVVVLFL